MDGVVARTANNRLIELVSDTDELLVGLPELTVEGAANLARNLLACAAAQSSDSPHGSGEIFENAYFPTQAWSILRSPRSDGLALRLRILRSLELTFSLPLGGVRALGQGLVDAADEMRLARTQAPNPTRKRGPYKGRHQLLS